MKYIVYGQTLPQPKWYLTQSKRYADATTDRTKAYHFEEREAKMLKAAYPNLQLEEM